MPNEPISIEQLNEGKAREEALQARVEDLTDFIENASIPLHWVNGSGVIIWANKTELDLLGYSKEEYIGKHISNFHADRKTSDDILDRLVHKQTLQNYPSTLMTKSGHRIPVLINSNVRWHGEKFIHTRCFTRDISDLKQLDEDRLRLINQLKERITELQTENEILKNELKAKNL